MSVAIAIVVAIAALVLVGWLGLQVLPAPFPEYPEASRSIETTTLPAGLPAPVEQWLRGVYGDSVPLVGSVVITGRGRIAPFGVWFPARFRFTHDAGKGYRHYIEATWFGLPFLKVNERYLEGSSLFEMPFGTESGPKVEQAANLGMWAELSSSAPSVFVTDTRVHWLPVDATTAILDVPLGGTGRDRMTARFDPTTGELLSLEGLRYRASSSTAKTLWTAAPVPGETVGPWKLAARGQAKWADMAQPWAFFDTEDLRYGVDVSAYLRARGI